MVSVPQLGRNDVLQSSPEAPHLLLMAADNLVANAIGPDDNSPHLLPVSNAEREGFYPQAGRARQHLARCYGVDAQDPDEKWSFGFVPAAVWRLVSWPPTPAALVHAGEDAS